ncbi:hypothetical protein P280DRAFT_469504 [Massarina eburnea CBS 473.64]|uniref:Uncharacterized protein n=1 Tax=Massarina eburnea CBS 473.64 TaxID=1395130 RepID=A0A6A6S0C7_9PLEO|nr:hypothetical protein P280DRAFT_469504 [Massarina eburnea CBS 473.64]
MSSTRRVVVDFNVYNNSVQGITELLGPTIVTASGDDTLLPNARLPLREKSLKKRYNIEANFSVTTLEKRTCVGPSVKPIRDRKLGRILSSKPCRSYARELKLGVVVNYNPRKPTLEGLSYKAIEERLYKDFVLRRRSKELFKEVYKQPTGSTRYLASRILNIDKTLIPFNANTISRRIVYIFANGVKRLLPKIIFYRTKPVLNFLRENYTLLAVVLLGYTSFENLKTKLVVKSFRDCGISLYPNSSEDRELKIKDLPNALFDGWEQERSDYLLKLNKTDKLEVKSEDNENEVLEIDAEGS